MNPLNHIMGTEEAAERWGLSQDHIKRLCRDHKVKAILIGKTWVLDKTQPNPKQNERMYVKMKNVNEMIGAVIETENHGNVRIIGFKEDKSWGNKINIYLGKPSLNTCVGSFYAKGNITGGALIVEPTDSPVSEYDENGTLIR